MTVRTDANELDEKLAGLPLQARVALIGERFSNAVFTTSLGMEDQLLTWAMVSISSIEIVTLQTGRLFAETQELIKSTNERYNISIKEIRPDAQSLSSYKSRYGRDGFYDSVEARKACCHVRKIEPLKRALAGAEAWITGLRRDQSLNRQSVPFAQWDDQYGLMKFNPLADWTADRIAQAIETHNVPINPLHGRGYPSIGCEPCTRAIKPGENERAGRWWWEQDNKRECGLHVGASETTSKIGRRANV